MSLDPDDWEAFDEQAHAALDIALAHLRERAKGGGPVWTPMPDEARAAVGGSLPLEGRPLHEVLGRMRQDILPYPTGNVHPGFFGWVHGGGSAAGLIAEMLAAAMNANCGGRDHAAIEVERQVVRWCAEVFGLPADTAGGILVTGTSQATVQAVHAARVALLGRESRERGAAAGLTGYASARGHACLAKAFELCGIGSGAMRKVPVDEHHRMRLDLLSDMIAQDREAGLTPLLVAGTAGTVDAGACDDLSGLADVAASQRLWMHVDGAFGAWLRIAGEPLASKVAGIERADSLAFDFHKWMNVPYDAGCLLVREEQRLADAFSARPDYLAAGGEALGGGDPWPCEFGIDLSRGFRALKVWTQMVHYGLDRLGETVAESCRVAARLGEMVEEADGLSLAMPVQANVCCFFVDGLDDAGHRNLCARIQASGAAAPSTTVIDGRTCLRAALVNHRTTERDVRKLVDAALALKDACT